jgi:predicted amidohydrolase YtcJ
MSSALFINAKAWQPDGSFSEAFGIKGRQFSFVGTNDEAAGLKSSYDTIADLDGRLVLPGLIDGHLHLVNGSLMRKRFDASEISDIKTLKSKILNYAELNPQLSWIIGGNLDLNTILKQADLSHKNFADKIYPDKAIYITNYDYHSAVCNSKALVASGLMMKIHEFSSEEVIKDKNGSPNGLIKEKALDFVFENLPQPTLEEKVQAVDDFTSLLHSFGITTVTDITLTPDLEVYRKLYELGRLKVRINSYIPFEEFLNLDKHREFTKK